MPDVNWQVVYESNQLSEVCIVKSYLESNGIEVVLKSDESMLYIGNFSNMINYQLWVPQSQFVYSQQLIEEKETPDTEPL